MLQSIQRWKQRQRLATIDWSPYINHHTTVLEIGTGDGNLLDMLQEITGCKTVGYDVQDLQKKTASNTYFCGPYALLQEYLSQHQVDYILIAYTLHHMTDAQIDELFVLLQPFSLPLIIVEEVYTKRKWILITNDIISNILQYGMHRLSFATYFQLNFKTIVQRKTLFAKHARSCTCIGENRRYGYVHTAGFLVKPR